MEMCIVIRYGVIITGCNTFLLGALTTKRPGKDKIVINSHWEPSLPNSPGKDKIWEEASATAATPESQAGR